MKDYSLFENFGIDLKDKTILDIFIARNKFGERLFEGGLVIIFEKFSKRGLLIINYTELGEWIKYYQFGNNIIVDFDEFFYEDDCYKEQIAFVQNVVKEYKIEDDDIWEK
jgi:hypothetical protein